jgi:hypothetical protein
VGAQTQENRSMDEVGRFLSMLRFDSKGKIEELLTKGDRNP